MSVAMKGGETGSQTIQIQPAVHEHKVTTIKLRKQKAVQWEGDTVDNELLNKKKSKSKKECV
jgi:hypothetical protein